jgi:3-dehydrosphinganine reductase
MRFQGYWKDKVVLITGGSSGIGLAAAKLLAASGAHLWLTARRAEVLDAARQQVEAHRHADASPCKTEAADVSEAEQAAAVVQRVQREAGRLDVVINSAGITLPGYFQDLPLEEFQKQMAVNYFGTLYVIRAALPQMLERRSGHIINISSMAGFLGVFGYSAYGASKFAVTGLSEVLRAEMKPHGIRISVAFPPDTDTPQLAFETPYKPPETKALSGTAKALSADVVARAILEQAARGHFLIFPGFDSRLFYILSTKLPKWLVFAVLDRIAASGQR